MTERPADAQERGSSRESHASLTVTGSCSKSFSRLGARPTTMKNLALSGRNPASSCQALEDGWMELTFELKAADVPFDPPDRRLDRL
jgi:hypothetical protein